MQFTSDPAGEHIIRAYRPGEIHLRDSVVRSHMIISAEALITDWAPPSIKALTIEDFALVLDQAPEIILLGTGTVQQFPGIGVMTDILKRGIAIEVMTTHAACSTFNVLVGEQRAVVAAMFVS